MKKVEIRPENITRRDCILAVNGITKRGLIFATVVPQGERGLQKKGRRRANENWLEIMYHLETTVFTIKTIKRESYGRIAYTRLSTPVQMAITKLLTSKKERNVPKIFKTTR